jgi:hypothetical protein
MTHAQQARQFGTKTRMTGTVAKARMACTHATTAWIIAARCAAAITIATMTREQAIATTRGCATRCATAIAIAITIALVFTCKEALQAIAGRVAATISAASAISTWRLG